MSSQHDMDTQWRKDQARQTRIRRVQSDLRAILTDPSLPERTRLVLTDAIAQVEEEQAHLVRRWD